MEYLGESQPCARWLPAGGTLVERWWNAGCPNPPSTSDLGLPHNFVGSGVNKVVLNSLERAALIGEIKHTNIFFITNFFEMFKFIF